MRYRKYGTTDTRLAWREQFSRQRKLFQMKLKDFWAQAIASCNRNMKAVWSNVKALMSPPAAANASPFSGDDCAKHFAEKVAKMRASTVNAPRPVIIPRPVTSVLSSFQSVAVKEIKDLITSQAAWKALQS